MRSVAHRSSPSSSWCLAAILALSAACSSDASSTSVDAPPATGLTFRLSYQSDVSDSVFVQSGTEFGGQGWLTVRPQAGADVAILDDCGVCNCDRCDPCAVCGAGLPAVTEVPHGGHLDWTWDALVFGDGTCATNGTACETTTPLAAGDYVAHFCWSWTSDGVGLGSHVGPLTCVDEPFTHPLAAPAIVEHHECACG